ncbi:MAG TPA: hypothetical protein VGJ25_10015 [Gaiellaceae bacterium]|jgi:hypothetical protein
MRLRGLSLAHAIVAVATLGCLTVLGLAGAISEGALSSLLSVVVGAVFGAAISQQASNGPTKAVIDAALERGAIIEQDARARAAGAGTR